MQVDFTATKHLGVVNTQPEKKQLAQPGTVASSAFFIVMY
jgi:hypothetical protein